MKKPKEDAYSPNQVLGTLLVSVFCITVLCGQTLWVPPSRIENLHVRSIVLAITDSAAIFASTTSLDRYLPAFRSTFLDLSGLSNHDSWDTRYFNRRSVEITASATGTLPTALPLPVLPVPSDAGVTAASRTDTAINDNPVSEGTIAATFASPAPVFIPVSSIHSRENPLRVFMFGDSQVFSLGSGLSRLAGRDSPVTVDFLAIHSSGFIRGDYYNWPTKLADTFREKPCEAAVMMLGMNDYQSFWNNRGEIMKKGTPEWEDAYREKCRSLIDVALTYVPRLYWIGMPAVKNRSYDTNLAYIDSVQNSLVGEYSPDTLVRLSLREVFPGTAKEYTDSITNGDGKSLKVMNDDGTHFTVEGGQVVMKPFFDRLSQDFLFSEVPVANLPK